MLRMQRMKGLGLARASGEGVASEICLFDCGTDNPGAVEVSNKRQPGPEP
jgi:hypothetical protein